ncbi:hypothetical protein [uncultured Clostridium sp.]|uniref:hypothetical protein n=1 Tax=uncultured Clostridium sp. TaxID=59620 RepID=UPI003217F2C9
MDKKINVKFNLNPLIGMVISKTLEFSGAEKSEEEINDFCLNLTKDDDFIKVCKEIANSSTSSK